MNPTTDDLARELGKLHTILHVAAGHPADEETDAETLRRVLPLRETLRAAAARLRELEAEVGADRREAYQGGWRDREEAFMADAARILPATNGAPQ